jgi:hypothetical protein
VSALGREPAHLGPADSGHIVQLFDGTPTFIDAVAAFLYDGWTQGDTLAIVATPAHWTGVAQRLAALGLPIEVAGADGRLTVRSAEEVLLRFMREGRPDPALFQASVGGLLHDLVSRGRPVRVVGEMVDVLAGSGEFAAAEALESLWNDLRAREPFRLFCAYAAATFSDPRQGDRLRRVCAAHSQVWSNPRDRLGSFRLATHAGPGL